MFMRKNKSFARIFFIVSGTFSLTEYCVSIKINVNIDLNSIDNFRMWSFILALPAEHVLFQPVVTDVEML